MPAGGYVVAIYARMRKLPLGVEEISNFTAGSGAIGADQ